MRKKKIIMCITGLACLIIIGAGVAYATAEENNIFLAGQLFKNAEQIQVNNGKAEEQTVASYDGHNITAEMVAYQRDMYVLINNETTAKDSSDREIIDRIIESIILEEEAQRLGIYASQTEIDAMVASAERAYTTPEGKEMMDSYFQGAGITLERYLEILREQAPGTIAKLKMKNKIAEQYCEENGLEYSGNNLTEEIIEAQEEYIDNLFQQHKDEIIYYTETE